MRILAVASVENEENIVKQLAKQTTQDFFKLIVVDSNPARGPKNRRKRIADNQRRLQRIVKRVHNQEPIDYIWQVEGDCELPDDCLERMIRKLDEIPSHDFGYLSGVQIGRHGLYHIGAWRMVDNDHFNSIEHTLTGVQEVDATGFYCLLAPVDVWLSGKASWSDEPYGPDVVWGLSIDKKKYIDMDLHIGHHHNGGIIPVDGASTCTAYFKKINNEWKYKTRLW